MRDTENTRHAGPRLEWDAEHNEPYIYVRPDIRITPHRQGDEDDMVDPTQFHRNMVIER